MSELLNVAQRRSVEIGLRTVEKHLLEARVWLQHAPEPGFLQQRRASLTPDQQAAILDLIDVAEGEIARLAGRFNLVANEQEFAAVFIAGMSAAWAILCDLRADKLTRYGEVDQRLADELDPGIELLTQLTLTLANLASESSSP